MKTDSGLNCFTDVTNFRSFVRDAKLPRKGEKGSLRHKFTIFLHPLLVLESMQNYMDSAV